MHYVYLICREQDFDWYVGCTADLRERLNEHNRPQTRLEMKYDLIYYEAYLHRLDAIRRECFLKSASGRDFLRRHLMWFLRLKQPRTYLRQVPQQQEVDGVRSDRVAFFV